MEAQSSSRILMVKPIHFNYNLQTANNNAFQSDKEAFTSPTKTQKKALEEFEAMVEKIESKGIEVLVVEDTAEPYTPDSIFPNNWITTHADGTIVLYPMYAPNRRLERKPYILEALEDKFKVTAIMDFSMHERAGVFLEGTGSLILDRPNKTAYACFSERTHQELLDEFGRRFNYEVIAFTAEDENGQAIYHTNVMMCVGDKFAVICLDSVQNPMERLKLLESLKSHKKEVIEITIPQMEHFAGNMLQVCNQKGDSLLFMSENAYLSLTEEQKTKLEKYAKIVYFSIQTIEKNGGGSVRCMIAENFLAKKT